MQKVEARIKIACLFFVLFVFAGNVFAAECSSRVKSSTAKAIASRETLYMDLAFLRARRSLEAEHQSRLTAQLSAKYATTSMTFLPSVSPIIMETIGKEFNKAQRNRLRESSYTLERLDRDIISAEKRYNNAANKVPNNLNCTL